ncbi:MAG: hypothetical protein P8076_06860 [Gammaproteobacteria bacterium]|jgi:hypothetical protein
MDRAQLEKLSQDELARRLADSPRYTLQWYQLKAECEKRMLRWGRAAEYAGAVILVCMLLLVLGTMLAGR